MLEEKFLLNTEGKKKEGKKKKKRKEIRAGCFIFSGTFPPAHLFLHQAFPSSVQVHAWLSGAA